VSKRSSGKAQQKRIADAAAKKQRRQKVIAFGGLGVLAILMFIQGPKLLKAFGGPDASTPTAMAATPVAPVPDSAKKMRALRLLKATGANPFAPRTLADNDPKAGSVPGPGGTHDPFARGAAPSPSTSAPAPAAAPVATPLPVVGTPKPGAIAKQGWIVVLASVPVGSGRSSAERFARHARRSGLRAISLLESSTREPLRAGYFVVYKGPYATLRAVQRAAALVHAFGYRTAYVRQIIRY
jgi:hypothetical protein